MINLTDLLNVFQLEEYLTLEIKVTILPGTCIFKFRLTGLFTPERMIKISIPYLVQNLGSEPTRLTTQCVLDHLIANSYGNNLI